ncbi:MAG: asparaginase [Desulfopila sp.]
MQRILILATGGTLVCRDDGRGLRPRYTVDDLLAHIDSSTGQRQVTGTTLMNIDSSNMTPDRWLSIARGITREYANYDGFVVTHGTDTMAYTGAALAYLLRGLNKPVVLTGAQYSMIDSKTDAVQNLHDALLLAGEELAGVFIVFDGKVINGTRAIKTKTTSYDAFESVNYPLVAEVKHNRIRYDLSVARRFTRSSDRDSLPGATALPRMVSQLEESILVLKLFPGLRPEIFDFIKATYRAVIIESYGTGGIATEVLDLASKVADLADNDIIVVVTTQCLKEGVHPEVYAVGRKLPMDRIVYARDMNTEAIVPKLMWALSVSDHFATIKGLIESPVQDDLVEPDPGAEQL